MELLRMVFPNKQKARDAERSFFHAEEIRFPQSLAGCKDIGLTWRIEKVDAFEWAFVVRVSE